MLYVLTMPLLLYLPAFLFSLLQSLDERALQPLNVGGLYL